MPLPDQPSRAALVRRAGADDADAVAALAARTFPLACPPTLERAHIDDFIAANLSAARFAEHLAAPGHRVYVCDGAAGPIGYALAIDGVHREGPVAWQAEPSTYLSKLYVDPNHHGGAAARALLVAVRSDALGAGVWLNVNRDNARAARFYAKSGFALAGRRRFAVGGVVFVDDVLAIPAGGE